jgi:uncharacterized glyoxalase superfamily protein PhnB
MLENRSMPAATVIPELVYGDVEAAVAWLRDVFGFTERWSAGGHRAQMAVGSGAVILAEERDGFRAPGGDGPSHAVMVRVEDVDAHHERARARGARILQRPTDFPYGERQYEAEDPAGHRWSFSQSIADVAPESWGGVPGPALG